MVVLPVVKKNCKDMYNRLDSIPACDRQTDGQTSCHGIVRAMHRRRAVKIIENTRTYFILQITLAQTFTTTGVITLRSTMFVG